MTRSLSLLSLCLAFLLAAAPPVGAQTVLHVDRSAAAAGDGSSWASPLTSLADALAQATAGDTVRVDQDTYSTAGGFAIPAGVTVRGSFTANTAQPTERDLGPGQKTILSGDVDGDGVGDGRVVDIENHPGPSTPTTLEGFVIKNGAGSGIGDEAGGTAVRTQGENGFSLVKQVEVRDNASDYSVVEVEGNTAILSSVIAKNTTNGPTVAATNWSGIMDRVTLADNSSDTYILGTNSADGTIQNSLLDKENSIETQTVTPVTIDGVTHEIGGDLFTGGYDGQLSRLEIDNGGETYSVPLGSNHTQNAFSQDILPVGNDVTFRLYDSEGNLLSGTPNQSDEFEKPVSFHDSQIDLTVTAEDRSTWVDEPYHQGEGGTTMSVNDAQNLEQVRVTPSYFPQQDLDGNVVSFDDFRDEMNGSIQAADPGRWKKQGSFDHIDVLVPYTDEQGNDLRDMTNNDGTPIHEVVYDSTMNIANMIPAPMEVDSTLTHSESQDILEDTYFGQSANNLMSRIHDSGPVNGTVKNNGYILGGDSNVSTDRLFSIPSELSSAATGIDGDLFPGFSLPQREQVFRIHFSNNTETEYDN